MRINKTRFRIFGLTFCGMLLDAMKFLAVGRLEPTGICITFIVSTILFFGDIDATGY